MVESFCGISDFIVFPLLLSFFCVCTGVILLEIIRKRKITLLQAKITLIFTLFVPIFVIIRALLCLI